MKSLFLFLILFISTFSFAQLEKIKKEYTTTKITTPPKVDGVLDDLAWNDAEEANGFIQFKPTMGIEETSKNKTIVKVTYDDNAIYIGAYLYDDPSKIMNQFTSRDNFGQSDFFGLIINPNNDAQNDTEFFVFSSGTQADAVATPNNEDFSWNAVWDSAVKIVSDGWIVEMKIPYSALRFSNKGPQTWGLNFHRNFRRTQEQYTWNPVDVTVGNIGQYHGELKGLKDISPPTRLSFFPFISGTETRFDGTKESNFGAGLDIKYGISENFTLDATLIPDFSQAGIDEQSLNLGPFEQIFSEQRQFFTEGLDLFNKGDLFYSRRIGNTPIGFYNVQANLVDSADETETIVENPDDVQMLNAIKVSGRTKEGLGIGFFNAITEKTEALIKNTKFIADSNDPSIINEKVSYRKEITEPFSNYNILVLDQQFNKNSSVSFINTNVTRNGHFRDANVSAALFNLSNKTNKYNIRGHAKMSNLNLEEGTETGFNSKLSLGKISGKYQFRISHYLADKKYDINDFGVSRRNNYNNFSINASYRIFEPTEKLNNFSINAWANYRQLYKPDTYTGKNFGANFYAKTKKLHDMGGNFNFQPGKQYDYFEPRTDGRYFIYENSLNANTWFSSNYNKTLAINLNAGFNTLFEKNRDLFTYWIGFNPRVRLNKKCSLNYSFDYNKEAKSRGYVTTYSNDDIIFGQRDQKTIVNGLSGSYNFNTLHALTLSLRNYWTVVNYENDLFVLEDQGRLSQNNSYTVQQTLIDDGDYFNPNINYNIWNLSLKYSWQFAPGSQLTALYRNQLFNRDDNSKIKYFKSGGQLFKQPFEHTFSLKVVYYLDYNNLKNVFKKSNT